MSETTDRTDVPSTAIPASEPNSAPPATPPDTSPPPVQDNPAPEQPAEQFTDEQLEAPAERLLKDCKKNSRSGEREYRKGLLESGRLAHEFIIIGLKRGQARAQAVDTIHSSLSVISSTTVDVNRLVRCYWSFALLCEAQELTKDAADMPYGGYVNGWSRLIQCEDQGKVTERYTLLPGMEQDCRALFADGIKGGWDARSSADRCGELHKRHVDASAAAKRVQEEKARQDKADAERAAERARLDKEAAERVTKDAEARLAQTAADQKAVTDKAEQDRLEALRIANEQELDKKRKELADAQSAADQKERERIDADNREKQAQKEREAVDRQKQKQDQKADGKGKKREPSSISVTGPAECKQGEPLLVTLAKTARSASSKDFGTMLAASICSAEDPMGALADTLTALAGQLDADPKTELETQDILLTAINALKDLATMSPKGKRVCQAAHLTLTRKDREPSTPSEPAGAHVGNGVLVVAGS